jgi:hypothetical protein
MQMFNSGGDEIDLYACGNYLTAPVAPSFGTDLWQCYSATCATDFMPPGSCDGGRYCGIVELPGTVQETAVALPEGGTALSYLLISLVPITLAILHSQRERTQALPRL